MFGSFQKKQKRKFLEIFSINMARHFFISLIFISLFISCTRQKDVNPVSHKVNEIEVIETTVFIDPILIRAQEIVSFMNDSLLVSQVLISGIDGRGSLPPYVIEMLNKVPSGGVMFFRYNLNTSNEDIKNLTGETVSLIKKKSDIPPFIAVDHEGGTVNRFLSGVADLPDASTYWDIFQKEGRDEALSKIEEDSFRAASVINELGFNMNFAPVSEYLNDDNRDFLLRRSYGSDPFFTSQAAEAFLKSMQKAGVLCVIKHFPVSAGADPHFSVSVINREIDELDMLTLPFIYLINNGARAIMTAHTCIPSLDSRIASLSPAVMQDWIKDDLEFSGIIIADDFTMAAAGDIDLYEAAVQSISAGADMILVWPAYLERTHSALMTALEEGTLPRDRLLDAVQRIIYEKLKMGLMD